MASPGISSGSNGATSPGLSGSETRSPGAAGSEAFQQQVNRTRSETASPAGPKRDRLDSQANAEAQSEATTGQAAEGSTTADEAAFQQQMFGGFASGVDPARQRRLAAWLPQVLNGGEGALKNAAKTLTQQQASDLNALSLTMDLGATAIEVPAKQPANKFAIGSIGGIGPGNEGIVSDIGIGNKKFAKAVRDPIPEATARNQKPLQQLQQAFGEHALKASTPQLAPQADYDSDATMAKTKHQVFEDFTKGIDQATRDRLRTWLPAAIKDPDNAVSKNDPDLIALATAHGLQGESELLTSVILAYQRDLAVATAGELPSVADMMLIKDHGERSSATTAFAIGLDHAGLEKAMAAYEKGPFTDLDEWLPEALAGRQEVPFDDAKAMSLLTRFAERMGFSGEKDATPKAAFDFLERSEFLENSLHAGNDGESRSFLLFSDTFLESTLKFGAKNGALSGEMIADAAQVAEMLLGPDDGTNAPRQLQMAGLQAAILHRTDETVIRPQEFMAASGHVNAGETLAEQKSRLVESLLAFHVREEIGTPPMTTSQWAASYEDISPELLDQVGGWAFNVPTVPEMQHITQHLGVPGDHSFMVDSKRKVHMSVDDLGQVEGFGMKKKKVKWYKKVLDIAVPVIGTVLYFVPIPGAAAVGAGINAAYAAYKGAEAIKNGDLMGGLINIAAAFTSGAAGVAGAAAQFGGAAAGAAASGAAAGAAAGGAAAAAAGGSSIATFANSATRIALGVQAAQGGFQAVRAAKDGDILGTITSALSAAASGVNLRGLQAVGTGLQATATGINVGRAVDSGNYLAAGAGLASLAGTATNAYGGSEGAGLAFEGVEHGLNLAEAIDDKNYAGIGNAASGLIKTGGAYNAYRQLPSEEGVGGRPLVGDGPDGTPNVKLPGNERTSIEVAGGDTLSQIAERHGVSVEALVAANPDIADPNRIHTGQQLALPEGVQPVVNGQQQRLQEFADSQGGPSRLPGPQRPDLQGQPSLSPADGASAMADAEFGVAIEVYQREFGEAVDKELSSIDQQIADIDQQLDDGVNHAPVAYHLKNERLKLMAQQRDIQAIADDPNAAFEALKAQQNDSGWTASDVGHMALDIIGLAPVVGEWADGLNAAWYFSEGDIFNGTLAAGATVPGIGIGATLGKWLGKGADSLRVDLDNPATKELVDGLESQGVRHTPENIVDIRKATDGKTVFLEIGSESAGLMHIVGEHGSQFVQRGIQAEDIPDAVMTAATQGKILRTQGKGRNDRDIIEFDFKGKTHYLSVTTSNNGFVVGANPTNRRDLVKILGNEKVEQILGKRG